MGYKHYQRDHRHYHGAAHFTPFTTTPWFLWSTDKWNLPCPCGQILTIFLLLQLPPCSWLPYFQALHTTKVMQFQYYLGYWQCFYSYAGRTLRLRKVLFRWEPNKDFTDLSLELNVKQHHAPPPPTHTQNTDCIWDHLKLWFICFLSTGLLIPGAIVI